MTENDPVEVYAAGDSAEARLVIDLLVDAGIAASVVGEPLQGILGDVPFFQAGPRVWVRNADAARARTIVAEYQAHLIERAEAAAPNPDAPTEAFCYHCGEAVPNRPTTCPACGKLLEWASDVNDADTL